MNLQEESAPSEWGLFRRPLFDDPSARALSRVGVVDVGSNSVRLVVFDGAARSPAYFYNEKIMCALGRGLAETGRLNPEGRTRALAALTRFQLLARSIDLPPLTAVATAAVRDQEHVLGRVLDLDAPQPQPAQHGDDAIELGSIQALGRRDRVLALGCRIHGRCRFVSRVAGDDQGNCSSRPRRRRPPTRPTRWSCPAPSM